jgi:DNA invertase Pin-like site-specific DNA recombinase
MNIVPTAVYNYCRVSTKRQGNVGISLAEQRDRCLRFCTDKGWVLTEVVDEVGSAYSKVLRKQKELMDRALPGSLIIVTSYDRFSRNVILGATAIQELTKRKIRVFSCQEQQDTLTAVGRYTFTITVAAGEFTSANTGAKVTATLAKQKREGIEHGRAKYGQSIAREVDAAGRLLKRKRVPDDKENIVIQLMTGLRNGITAKKATTLMNKVVAVQDRSPVEFLDAEDQVLDRVAAGALNCGDIANLLQEYYVPYRNGKPWTVEVVRRILAAQEREVAELGAGVAEL